MREWTIAKHFIVPSEKAELGRNGMNLWDDNRNAVPAGPFVPLATWLFHGRAPLWFLYQCRSRSVLIEMSLGGLLICLTQRVS